MDLLEACLKADGRQAVNSLRKMLGSAKPSAIWAILMHAAAWHEERTYDTPHACILTYTIHRMIEDLGPNPEMLEETVVPGSLPIPDELREPLQNTLIQRLAFYLADVDHWRLERGPKYDIDVSLESMSNAVQNFELSIRKRSHTGVMKAALVLASKTEPVHLMRATATLAAEEPDRLGHGFILPVSLVAELPQPAYTRPQMASLWHLAEYLVRKVPSKRTVGAGLDASVSRYAKPTDVSSSQDLIAASVVDYGTLGHNGIFAHRIVESASNGWVDSGTVDWLLRTLKRNIPGTDTPAAVEDLIKKQRGTDWPDSPTHLRLPDSDSLRSWLLDNTEFWSHMMDEKSSSFEARIPSLSDHDTGVVRASQYAMSAINGVFDSPHVMIFSHAVWSLADLGLVSDRLAALQVHRMLRQHLKGR